MNCTLNDCSGGRLPLPDISMVYHNLALFSERFPQLSESLGFCSKDITVISAAAAIERMSLLLEPRKNDIQLDTAKSGDVTVAVNGKYMHSKYNPLQEAQRAAAAVPQNIDTCVFPGLGLGYLPQAWCANRPESSVIILEPDAAFLFLTLMYRDCSALFSHPKLCIILESPLDVLCTILNADDRNIERNVYLMMQPPLFSLNSAYYRQASEIIDRIKEKNRINEATRLKFGKRWLSNMYRNMAYMQTLPSISCFTGIAAEKNRQTSLPVLLIAAGPSLDESKNILQNLAQRCIVICVDTSLRFCRSAGIQPDFVVLVDPQYWNYRHIADLTAPETCFITETAAYPAVFRFKCRSTFLCSSFFPLGRFFESQCGAYEVLGAGGSVATTAWSFAALLGAPVVYTAGLDLSYPGKKTHFTGSLFEERAHTVSSRLHPVETQSSQSLFAAGKIPAKNYRGDDIATDRRMQLYAWWFESKIAAQSDGIRAAPVTKTLTQSALVIPGICPANESEYQNLPVIAAEKKRRIDTAVNNGMQHTSGKNARFRAAVDTLCSSIADIKTAAEEGCAEAKKAQSLFQADNRAQCSACSSRLADIDKHIKESGVIDIISMTLPGEPQHTESEYTKKQMRYEHIAQSAALHMTFLDKLKKNSKELPGAADT